MFHNKLLRIMRMSNVEISFLLFLYLWRFFCCNSQLFEIWLLIVRMSIICTSIIWNFSYSNVNYSNFWYLIIDYSNFGYYSSIDYSNFGYSNIKYSNFGYLNIDYSNIEYLNIDYSNFDYSNVNYSKFNHLNDELFE